MKYSFIFLLLGLLIASSAYVFVSGYQAMRPLRIAQIIFTLLMIISFACFLLTFLLPETFGGGLAKTIHFVGYSFMILLLYLFMAVLLIDVVRVINHFGTFIKDISQFRFLSFSISMVVIILLMIAGNYKFNHPQKVELSINSNKQNIGKELKIVAISDVHIGTSIDNKRLAKYVQLINKEKPDLVLIAGDLIDRSIETVIRNNMEEELNKIIAPLGVYAVLGNHEYYTGNLKAVTEFYKNSNITLIRDTTLMITENLFLVGRDDSSNSRRLSISQLTKSIPKNASSILLDHQPREINEVATSHIDLQISGHTHKGQIFPGNFIVKNVFELPYGFKKINNTHFYVSSGLGIWGPQYRIGSQSEYVVIRFEY